MDQKQDLKTWTLSLACNRLASHLTGLQQNPNAIDPARVYEVNQLVTRALEIIERQAKPPTELIPAQSLSRTQGSSCISSGW